MTTHMLAYRSDRKKTPTLRPFRPLTETEFRTLRPGQRVAYHLPDESRYVEITINGKVREWKRNPTRAEVPCKYGLREYFTVTLSDHLQYGMLLTPAEGV